MSSDGYHLDKLIDEIERKSKKKSIRYNKDKPRMDLIPISALEAMSEVLTYGLKKYNERQWEDGNNFSVPYASLLRHLTSWWEGEDKDKESNLSHLYHVIMNAAMLIEYEKYHKQLDDRPRK